MQRFLTAVAGATLLCAAGPAFAETATIKVGSFAGAKTFTVAEMYKPWMREVEKASGGTLQFKEFWGGSVIRSPRKQYEGMLNGLQDASPILPSYTQKVFPDFSFNALPFLFRDGEEASSVGWKMYEAGLLRGMDKVYVAAVWTNDNGGMHFNQKIEAIDDIKGRKMRAAGPAESAVIEVMGGIPVGMGITQVAQSLHRGVIQGTFNGWSALQSFRITPLIKTHVDMPFGVRGFFFGIHKPVFDKLPAKARKAIEDSAGLALSRKWGRKNENRGIKYREQAANDPERNVIRPPSAVQAEYAKKFDFLYDQWVKERPDGAAKLKTIRRFIAEYRKSS